MGGDTGDVQVPVKVLQPHDEFVHGRLVRVRHLDVIDVPAHREL